MRQTNYFNTYTPSYARALHSYAVNGFLARDLDADDLAFIERIRDRGEVACGSLAQPAPTHCTHSDDVIPRVALVEEMDFWRGPYALDKAVNRRLGPVFKQSPRSSGVTPQALERIRNRELLAELEAEEQRAKERKQREKIRYDIEWELAAPKRAFGKVIDRHYVPQWKIDEYADGKLQADLLSSLQDELAQLERQHAVAEEQRADAARKREEATRQWREANTRSKTERAADAIITKGYWLDLDLQQRIADVLKGHQGFFNVRELCATLGLHPEIDFELVLNNCIDASKRGLIKTG